MKPVQAIALAILSAAVASPALAKDDLAKLKAEAARVSIVRDDWGVAHVTGKTDADAVFGMIYAQAEDDFNRVETNYINAMGRLAEAEGESAVWRDLRMKLFIDPANLKALYARSPAWLKALMVAWADGLNYYLATHPQVKPRVITHFEPWMALSFTEGSIGGDIERVSLRRAAGFLWRTERAGRSRRACRRLQGADGSNGMAVAPSRTADGHALLLINPHTSFFFRSELQMASGEGLDAYGAVTWGQFFIYQGFNEHAGWMHTSSGVDVVDEFVETVTRRPASWSTNTAPSSAPVTVQTISVPYRAADGKMASRSFTVYKTHHGPVVRAKDGKWISIALMQKPVEALSQSYLRTKASDYASFVKVADQFKANSSNNTIFADSKGEIAYLHPQFIPKRDDQFDYTKPVDGSDPATDWGPLPQATGADAPCAEPGVGLDRQLQQLAVVVRWAGQSAPRRLPALHGYGRRNAAWPARADGAAGLESVHAAVADESGLRQLPAGVRAADPVTGEGVRRSAMERSHQDTSCRPDRTAAGVGRSLVCDIDRDITGRVLGRGDVAAIRRPRQGGRYDRL